MHLCRRSFRVVCVCSLWQLGMHVYGDGGVMNAAKAGQTDPVFASSVFFGVALMEDGFLLSVAFVVDCTSYDYAFFLWVCHWTVAE